MVFMDSVVWTVGNVEESIIENPRCKKIEG